MRLLSDRSLYCSAKACRTYLREFVPSVKAPPRDDRWLFHGYWSGTFGAKQALCIKSFLATQDLSSVQLRLWLDRRSGFNGYATNPFLKPFLPMISVRAYDFQEAAADVGLAVIADQARRLPHQSDLFRLITLHHHGGCYFDLDMLFLRDFRELPFVSREDGFCYKWSDKRCANSAILNLPATSDTSSYLLAKAIQKGSCHPWDLFDLDDDAVDLTVLPSTFFDPLWLYRDRHDNTGAAPFQFFSEFFRPIASDRLEIRIRLFVEFVQSCFTYHWHNYWKAREWNKSIGGYFNRRFDSLLKQRYNIEPHRSFVHE